MTGVVLSAPMDELSKCPLVRGTCELVCQACKQFAEWARTSQVGPAWKPKLDQLCSIVQPEEMKQKCLDRVDKYIHDLDTLPAEEFCKEVKLCH